MAVVTRFLQPPAQGFFLFGPRGTGKSTWLAQMFPLALRIDLLAPELLRAFQAGAAKPPKSTYTLNKYSITSPSATT